MQHQAVDSEPADGADQTFLPIIEFLFPYANCFYTNCTYMCIVDNLSFLILGMLSMEIAKFT